MMNETAEDLAPQTALITLQEIDPPAIFGEGGVQQVIDYIRSQVADVGTDVSTSKGRAEIKTAAYRVTRSKTLLDEVGKTYATELRKKLEGINGHRRKIRDDLDTLKDEIRKPLTEWEEAAARLAEEIAGRINWLIGAGLTAGPASASIAEVLAEVKGTKITKALFGERKGEAAIAKDVAVSNLERALAAAKIREEEATELERLRNEKKERDRKDAEDKRIREAHEQARADVDREARERVETAEREAREAKERADRAESDAQEKIDRDRRDREDKERREREAEEERGSDREHRRKINRAAVDALREWGDLTEEQAQTVITLIAAGRVPAVAIRY